MIIKKVGPLLQAIVLGSLFGLFLYGYWLADLLPLGSRRLLLFSILAVIGGAVGFYILLRWLRLQLAMVPSTRCWQMVGWSLLLGPFLFFASTSQWLEPARYLGFLLPEHSLEISLDPGNTPETFSLTWFHSSLGDIPYNTIDYQGWEKKDGQLNLLDFSTNSFNWTGRTGDELVLVFEALGDGELLLSLDGKEELLELHSGQLIFGRSMSVPWYATQTVLLVIAGLLFSIFSLALLAWILPERYAWMGRVEERVASSPVPGLGGADWVMLSGLLILTLALRVINLEVLAPHVEEYQHMNAAKQLLLGTPVSNVYQRSLYLVTIPVSGFFAIAGSHVWSARLAGVLFNTMAILPLYLVMKKVNRPVAILSCVLFATSPLIVATSRLVREYAYYPFYFYLVLYGLSELYEAFPKGFVFSGWRRLIRPRLITLAFLLLLPLFYAFKIDSSSTSNVIVMAYAVFIPFLIGKFHLRNTWNLLFFAGFGAGLIIAAGFIVRQYMSFIDFSPENISSSNAFWFPLQYFFFNPSQQWYFDRLVMIPVLVLLCAAYWSFVLRRKNYIPVFLLLLFVVSMLVFLFVFDFKYEPRYSVNILLWYIPLLGIGLYCIWLILSKIIRKKLPLFLILIAGVLSAFNFQHVLLPLSYTGPGFMPITGEYSDNFEVVHPYLLQNAGSLDALVASNYYCRFIDFVDESMFSDVHCLDKSWFSYVSKYDTGWIVVNRTHYWTVEGSMPLDSFIVDDKQLDYVGMLGEDYVWKWQTIVSP